MKAGVEFMDGRPCVSAVACDRWVSLSFRFPLDFYFVYRGKGGLEGRVLEDSYVIVMGHSLWNRLC